MTCSATTDWAASPDLRALLCSDVDFGAVSTENPVDYISSLCCWGGSFNLTSDCCNVQSGWKHVRIPSGLRSSGNTQIVAVGEGSSGLGRFLSRLQSGDVDQKQTGKLRDTTVCQLHGQEVHFARSYAASCRLGPSGN